MPDVCHTKEPLLIELFGTYWHGENFPKAQEQDRIDHFKRFGYNTLVIWDDENIEAMVIKKVQDFLHLTGSKPQ